MNDESVLPEKALISGPGLLFLGSIRGEATGPPVEDMMLKNLPAKDFDRLYVHMMVPGHRQTVQMFEKYALTGKDPDVRAFAQQMLPILKEHLASITAIDNSMKNAAAK